MNQSYKIYVPGHTGLLGSAVVRKLREQGYRNILTMPHNNLDLISQDSVDSYFATHQPDYVIICAGKVGGIMANNTQRGDFIYKNTMMQFNILHAAYTYNCKKVMAIGSSCIYPAYADQPISEASLMTGELEPTNEPYAISKIAALKMCEAYRRQYDCNFISAMPTNLYGNNDTYDLFKSHVLPSLIKRFHDAKINNDPSVTIWGTGTVRREFLHADDCAEALIFLMNNYDESGHVNIGTGEDITIQELAVMIKGIVGYEGEILNDTSKPDGMKRKVLNISKINALGWKAKIELDEGIKLTYHDYCTKHR